MIEVFRRYFEEHRGALVALFTVLLANVGFYFLVTAPAQLRAHSLRSTLDLTDEQLRTALREFGSALLESRLIDGATKNLDHLYTATFQTTRERFAVVDSKIKEIAAKFQLEPHTISYDYSQLQKERLEQLAVSFALKGPYSNLRKFITEVEQAKDADGKDLFFAIERISLADSTETGADLNLSIVVTTYFHKPELAELDVDRKRGR